MIPAGLLRRVDILRNLSDDELEIFQRFLDEVRCASEDPVFHQGEEGNELFIVGEGEVAIRVRAPEGIDVDVAQLGPGDFFGEMAIFEDAPRSATCVMVEGGLLYRLRKRDFFSLMERHPQTAIKVMYRMVNITTGRLNHTSSFLSDLVQWGEGARRRAITDDLTGLHNRRYLDGALDHQIAEARVKNGRFSLIMMDLDRFHGINDTYGQQFGDSLIAAVAPSVKQSLGEGDIAARYGGDEFTIILPGKPSSEALAVAESIRRAVEQLDVHGPDGVVKVTTSQGVAEFPRDGASAESIKEAADQALYRAKEAGRNRAVAFDQA
ncbi:MAG: diguanylate cyclase [Spirochaetota bacterium]